MSIEDILAEMENLLLDASRVPLTNKRVIEEDDLARLIDALREALPAGIADANRIVSERQRILDEAQKEAQNIVSQAQNYVCRLTDENVIARQAQEKAQELMTESRATAQEIQNNALHYAGDVFKYVENVLEKTLDVVRKEQQNIEASKNSQA